MTYELLSPIIKDNASIVMRVKTQRLLPGKDCRQQTLSHIDGIFLHESFP